MLSLILVLLASLADTTSYLPTSETSDEDLSHSESEESSTLCRDYCKLMARWAVTTVVQCSTSALGQYVCPRASFTAQIGSSEWNAAFVAYVMNTSLLFFIMEASLSFKNIPQRLKGFSWRVFIALVNVRLAVYRMGWVDHHLFRWKDMLSQQKPIHPILIFIHVAQEEMTKVLTPYESHPGDVMTYSLTFTALENSPLIGSVAASKAPNMSAWEFNNVRSLGNSLHYSFASVSAKSPIGFLIGSFMHCFADVSERIIPNDDIYSVIAVMTLMVLFLLIYPLIGVSKHRFGPSQTVIPASVIQFVDLFTKLMVFAIPASTWLFPGNQYVKLDNNITTIIL